MIFKFRSKREYMECNFRKNKIKRGTIKPEKKEIASIRCFKYLGFELQSSGNKVEK